MKEPLCTCENSHGQYRCLNCWLPLHDPTRNPTAKELVMQKHPEAQCQWTSRGWRVWAGNIDDGIVELGRTISAHVPESEAWEDAAKKMVAAREK